MKVKLTRNFFYNGSLRKKGEEIDLPEGNVPTTAVRLEEPKKAKVVEPEPEMTDSKSLEPEPDPEPELDLKEPAKKEPAKAGAKVTLK